MVVFACAILHNVMNSIGVEIPDVVVNPDATYPEVPVDWDGMAENDSVRDVLVELC